MEQTICACGCGEPTQGIQSRWARGHSRRGLPEDRPLCACGCGERVQGLDHRFLKGHAARRQWGELPLCACGCGTQVRKRGSLWVQGHSSRRYCACGCGTPIIPPHRFVKDHHKRKPGVLTPCACGCGELVRKIGNQFIKGHSTRLRFATKSDPSTFSFCQCGCGQRVTKEGNQWIIGHTMRTVNFHGPTTYETLVQRAFQGRGRAFLFNVGIEGAGRPDFQFPEVMLIVEIDGREHRMAVKRNRDRDRDALLTSQGWKVLRWPHSRIENHMQDLLAEFEQEYELRLLALKGK